MSVACRGRLTSSVTPSTAPISDAGAIHSTRPISASREKRVPIAIAAETSSSTHTGNTKSSGYKKDSAGTVNKRGAERRDTENDVRRDDDQRADCQALQLEGNVHNERAVRSGGLSAFVPAPLRLTGAPLVKRCSDARCRTSRPCPSTPGPSSLILRRSSFTESALRSASS